MSTATVWLINPKGRAEKGKTTTMSKTKKPRTAAQKEATRQLVALNKARRARSGSVATTAASKPARRKYKRNPLPPRAQAHVNRGKNMFTENLLPAAIGAGGALAFDIVWGKLPLSASMRTGILRYPVKLLGALALGVAAEKLLPDHQKHHAVTIAQGSMVVLMHEAAKDFLAVNMPSLHLAAYEADQMAEIIELNGLGAGYGYKAPVEYVEVPAIEDLSGSGGVGENMELNENLELNGAYDDDY